MISVCMPSYNGEKYIGEQLRSILDQLSDEDEVIISDDSSSDDTLRVIAAIGDKRIKVLSGDQFRSPIFNLENALKHAKGEIIFLADQDDVWLPGKVKIMTDALKDHTCAVSDAILTDGELNIIGESYFALKQSGKGILKNLVRNSYVGCCMAFRRSLLKIILPFPKDIPMHDSWIGINAEIYGSSIFIGERLIKFRRHGDNASMTGGKSSQPLWVMAKQRAALAVRLFLRIFGL